MAYDEEIADRFRAALEGFSGVQEKKMMGGLCFMLDGNMVGGVNTIKGNKPRFMFRVGKENKEAAQSLPAGRPMTMGDRIMGGFYEVDADECSENVMRQWMSLALSFVCSLPPK